MSIALPASPWLKLQAYLLQRLDALQRGNTPAHLATGLRGEREALFHLRQRGYTVVARRWKDAKLRGDIDLVAWDGDALCFVEVKTRTGRDRMSPAEAAVDDAKRRMLRPLARAYVRRFPEKLRRSVRIRFDVMAVYLAGSQQPGKGVEFELYKGAFGWE